MDWAKLLDWITPLVAIYAAIISTLLLVWRVRRDRSKLRVAAKLQFEKSSNVTSLIVVYVFTNTGHRTVTVDGRGIVYRDAANVRQEEYNASAYKYPKPIKEGESDELTLTIHRFPADVYALYIMDALDKKWFVSKRNLRRVRWSVRDRFHQVSSQTTSVST